jgi:hypothetical protein
MNMTHATYQDAQQLRSTAIEDRLEIRGVDGYCWLDAGLSGRLQGALEQLLCARALGHDDLADAIVDETRRWLETLDAGERLEASLQIIARWSWLWSADAEEDPERELVLTTLAAWIADDIASLLDLSLDGLAAARLPQDHLALLLRASAASLFDLSHLLPRWRVVDIAASTLEREPATRELLGALETLRAAESRPASQARRAAESRPASQARRAASNRKTHLEAMITRARSSLSSSLDQRA